MYEISGKYSSIVCLDLYLIFLFSAPVHPPITLSGRVSRTQIDQAALEPSDQSYMDKILELRDLVKTANSEKAVLQEKVRDLVEAMEEKHHHNLSLTKRIADLERRVMEHETYGIARLS